MKKSVCLLTLTFALFGILSCGLFNQTGELEGMKIYVGIADDTRSLRSTGTSNTFPQNAKIAVTKLWLPYAATYESLKEKYVAGEGTLVLSDVDLDNYAFYKAIERTDADPYIFDAGSSEPFTPTAPLPYETIFYGVLLETLYWEFVMDDFSIRWYQRDSGVYRRGDVLVYDGTDWKWAYLQRTMNFTFQWMDTAVIEPDYNQIIAIPGSLSEMPVEVVLSPTRVVSGAYFENWIGAHRVDPPDQQYIYNAITTYKYDGDTSIYSCLRAESYSDPGPHVEVSYTLKQYYNIAGDTRMDAVPGDFVVGENPLELLPQVGTYTNPNTWDRGLHPYPFIMIGSGGDDTLDSPKEITTFPEAANEAEYWLLKINYDFANAAAAECGLVFQALNQTPPEVKWSNLKDLAYFFTLNPIAAGMELQVGWQDFNGDLQGEFSPDAGE